ncbi:hypothetical protein F5887DRAFT_919822 [Amanita rubescens]|nr:hypothetical protein F5887DRAFT_919822 [Amanita rubescens]
MAISVLNTTHCESINLDYTTTNEEKCRMFPIESPVENTRIKTPSTARKYLGDFRQDVTQRHIGHCVLCGFTMGTEAYTARESAVLALVETTLYGISMTFEMVADSVSGQTPNFALDTLDVSPNADNTQEWFTAHLFTRGEEGLGFLFNVPSGTKIRVARDKSDWPPAVLFEAVMQAW